MKTCSIDGCTRAHYAKGLCQTDYRREYNSRNREKARKACLSYVDRNKELVKSKFDAYRELHKERFKSEARARALNNRAYINAVRAKRRTKKKAACPPWTNLAAIREIYKTCPSGHHVDHIIPLEHPKVCGLHVPWNLQHLPALENISKGNKLLEEYCRVETTDA